MHYILPAKLAASLLDESKASDAISSWRLFALLPLVPPLPTVGARTTGHLLVTLMRFEKNSMPDSPVMSMSPYLDSVLGEHKTTKSIIQCNVSFQGSKKN